MSKLFTVIFLILSTLVVSQNSSQERAVVFIKNAIAQKVKNDPRTEFMKKLLLQIV